MKRCSSCRFFSPTPHPLNQWDVETGKNKESGHHDCVRIIHGNDGDEEQHFAEPAVVTDGSGYAAVLRVLPTFGCILYESKS